MIFTAFACLALGCKWIKAGDGLVILLFGAFIEVLVELAILADVLT